MASTDAQLAPWRNNALRITFALRLNNGQVNSGAAGLDSEVSKDGGTFTDCTNEATEIASSSGIYYLDLTAGEMDGDTVAIVVKSSTANAITYDQIIYTQSAINLANVNVNAINGSQSVAARQASLIGVVLIPSVDSSTYTPTTVDFETSLTTNYATDYFKGRSIIFTGGALQYQAARIVGSTYTGNNKIKLTVTLLTAAPSNGVFFCLV
jgi:hypothetical protein